MSIEYVMHVGICVRDLPRSIRFYRDGLGFARVARPGDREPHRMRRALAVDDDREGQGEQSRVERLAQHDEALLPGRGKQRGTVAHWRSQATMKTSDDRWKCLAFNRAGCEGECSRVHICLVCGGARSMKACPDRPRDQPKGGEKGAGKGKGQKSM